MGNNFNVYRALFLKSTSFQLRQIKSNVFQAVLVGLLMGLLIYLSHAPVPKTPPPTVNFVDNNVSAFATTGVCSTYVGTGKIECNIPLYNNLFYYDPNNVAGDILAGGLKTQYYYKYDYANGNFINVSSPVLTRFNSVNEITTNYSNIQNEIQNHYSNYTYQQMLEYQSPTAAILFDKINDQGMTYTVQLPPAYAYSAYYTIQDPVNQALYVETWLLNSYLQKFTNKNQTIQTFTEAFAGMNIYNNFAFSDIPKMIGIFFIPSTLIFILPIFVYTIVHEKQERLVEMMKMMGIGMKTYWISNYSFSMIVYCVIALFVILLGAIGGVSFFTDVNPLTYIILFFLYGLAQTSFAFFLSTFFSKAKTSVIVCYFIVMLLSGIGSNVQMIVFTCNSAPWIFLAFPGFALARGIYLITYTTTGTIPFPIIDLTGHGYTPLIQVYVYLLLEAPIFLILAWYLDCVLPRENGVNYSPLFPIKYIISFFKAKSEEKKSILHPEEEVLLDSVPVDDVTQAIEFEDEDCLNERRKAHSNNNFLIKIIDLHKKYAGRGGQPAKDALVKFCMALEQGECLGLLGPNGAGKTTLISILCGLSSTTSGTALVAGFDITTEMYKVHQILGFCPQHDILWVDLTVEDHLLFYCRLKGYSKQSERDHVNKIATDVGLGGFHLRKKVSELSGGMKRRLSIAIALVGDSKLVLLDEPTTGLDPDTRRHVWDIINNYKASRSIIITTHNIDEADVLCSKIAIMSLGSLKCIGSSQYLKNKFGAGYKLSSHLSPAADVEAYVKWVKSMFSQAEQDPAAGTVDFIIPASDMNVAKLFSVMKQNKEKFGILEWAINQMSLEEVFLKMVATDESQF